MATHASWEQRAAAAANLRVQRGVLAASPIRPVVVPEPGYVLVVDDEPNLRRMLEVLLTNAGHRTEAACDGWQAMQQVLASRPQLVITDLQMPEMNGLELIRTLRMTPAYADIPVIVYTGSGPDPHLREGLDNVPGVIHVLQKGGRPSELVSLTSSLIGNSPDGEESPGHGRDSDDNSIHTHHRR